MICRVIQGRFPQGRPTGPAMLPAPAAKSGTTTPIGPPPAPVPVLRACGSSARPRSAFDRPSTADTSTAQPRHAAPMRPGPPAPAALGARRQPAPIVAKRDGAATGSAPAAIDTGGLDLTAPGQALPDPVRLKMEQVFGQAFGSVRVRVGPQAETIGALAFTMGEGIWFAPGRYDPTSARGQELLGHELAHVVQQREGRVRAPAGVGIAVVDDAALEREADVMGARAAAAGPVDAAPPRFAPAGAARPGTVALMRWSIGVHESATGRTLISESHLRCFPPAHLKVVADGKQRAVPDTANFSAALLANADQIVFCGSRAEFTEASATAARLLEIAAAPGLITAGKEWLIDKAERRVDPEAGVAYPFPTGALPTKLYRWCSDDELKLALVSGIKKYGGVHDGIPTLPAPISKERAKTRGGVGIVSADKCLEIDLSKIPGIAAKRENSLRKTTAKNGTEFKVLVDIPKEALRDCTKDMG